MEALVKGKTFGAEVRPESVRNIVARYGEGYFPEEIAYLKRRLRVPGGRRSPRLP